MNELEKGFKVQDQVYVVVSRDMYGSELERNEYNIVGRVAEELANGIAEAFLSWARKERRDGIWIGNRKVEIGFTADPRTGVSLIQLTTHTSNPGEFQAHSICAAREVFPGAEVRGFVEAGDGSACVDLAVLGYGMHQVSVADCW